MSCTHTATPTTCVRDLHLNCVCVLLCQAGTKVYTGRTGSVSIPHCAAGWLNGRIPSSGKHMRTRTATVLEAIMLEADKGVASLNRNIQYAVGGSPLPARECVCGRTSCTIVLSDDERAPPLGLLLSITSGTVLPWAADNQQGAVFLQLWASTAASYCTSSVSFLRFYKFSFIVCTRRETCLRAL